MLVLRILSLSIWVFVGVIKWLFDVLFEVESLVFMLVILWIVFLVVFINLFIGVRNGKFECVYLML